MFAIEEPAYLLLLILVPLGIWFQQAGASKGGHVYVAMSDWHGQAFASNNLFSTLVHKTFSLLPWFVYSLLIFALAEPIVLGKSRVYLHSGKEIIFLVDISPSMAAQDVPEVSRLQNVKDTIRNFVAKRSNDDIGLLAFASEAALYCPPTRDYDSLLASVDRLRVMDLGEGTSLGLGLSVSAIHFSDDPQVSKVLILMSDGDNNTGEIAPLQASELLRSLGVTVHVIGMGTNREVYLEYEDPKTNTLFRASYDSRFDEKLLTDIAAKGSGLYYYAAGGEALSNVLGTIDSLELSDSRVRYQVTRTALQNVILLLALLGLLIDLFLRRAFLREVA